MGFPNPVFVMPAKAGIQVFLLMLFWMPAFAGMTILFSSLTYASCTVTDDRGTTIQLQKPATRIIALAPDLTETLFAIGADRKMIGVVSGSDYPAPALNIPKVGSYSGIDLERIVSMKPDLIVMWGSTFSRQLSALKKWHIPIYISEPKQLEDVARTMKNLGCLTGENTKANQAADNFLSQLKKLQSEYQQKKIITVFYQLGDYSLMTINKDSWINQVITLCGGRNLFAESKTIAPEIGWEAVLQANPQVIFNSGYNNDWKKHWQKWSQISAVKNSFLFTIHPDLIDRAGPRLLQGVREVCVKLEGARHV